MASGDIYIQATALSNNPPATVFAVFDTHAGGSTPNEAIAELRFDDTTEWFVDVFIPYWSKAVNSTVRLVVGFETEVTVTDEAVMAVAIRRLDSAEDLSSAHTYDYEQAEVDPPDNVNKTVTVDIAMLIASQMDGIVEGEPAIIRIKRVVGDAADTATGDVRLKGFSVRET